MKISKSLLSAITASIVIGTISSCDFKKEKVRHNEDCPVNCEVDHKKEKKKAKKKRTYCPACGMG